MSKKLKAFISAALALAVALAALPAFALNPGDTVFLTYSEDYGDECIYQGAITTGKTTVFPSEDYYTVCFSFMPQETGYYMVSYDLSENNIALGTPLKNNVVKEYLDYFFIYENEYSSKLIFKAEKDSELFLFSYGPPEEGTAVSLEYMGESVSNISLTFGDNDCLIIGNDIDCYEMENGLFELNINSKAKITFSSGKSIVNTMYFEGKASSEIKPGLNSFSVSFAGEEYTVTAVCRDIRDFVKDAKLSNADKYTAITSTFDGFEYPEIGDETITLTFADGSTKSFEYSPIYYSTASLPNGRDYELCVYYYGDYSGEEYLSVSVGYYDIALYPCEIRESSFSENAKLLSEKCGNCRNSALSYLKSSAEFFFSAFGSPDYAEMMDSANICLYWAMIEIRQTFIILSDFIHYYSLIF